MLVAVALIGVVLHVLMDLPTSYGTRVLSPFDWHWFAVDWMPIVDIYLLMMLLAGSLGFGRPSPAVRRNKAAVVLTLMAANYGLRAYAHGQAWSSSEVLRSDARGAGAIQRLAQSPDRLVAADERCRRLHRRANGAWSMWRRCRHSARLFNGGLSRSTRTRTRSGTSISSTAASVTATSRTRRHGG
jgi:hypothetical protein